MTLQERTDDVHVMRGDHPLVPRLPKESDQLQYELGILVALAICQQVNRNLNAHR
ncbi:hypothetical protein [Kitasatospora paranensis]|uniref:hypothetical protein n=1 Tax=Kitasatospora paranensis TaxID=258053 RepID=UPI0031E97257